MTRLVSTQKTTNRKVASAQLTTTCYETMIRCAELNGYESISDFVKDAILAKCESTAYAMINIVKDSRSPVAAAK